MRNHTVLSNDRGVSLIMVAMALMLLMGAAAIAIDLAAMRLDRSADQKVTDSAASAGALVVFETGSGEKACQAAVAYAAINAEEIGTLDATNCVDFPSTSCDATTAAFARSFSFGRFDITVTYPVPDGDPLMTSGLLGAPTQGLVTEDGDSCNRVAVEMSAVHQGLFAQLLGFNQGTTTVHSVARAFLPPPDGPPINLLLLDRFGCEVMKASGQGGIIIDEVLDLATGDVFPGQGAVDSDASIVGGCPSEGGTIDIDGNNALIRADGPPCANEDPPGSGEGCGFIETLAPGTPGCNWPACTASGSGPNNPNPAPTALPGRLTRAPIDHRYNCRPDYSVDPGPTINWAVDVLTVTNEQDIPGCESGGTPEIYNLIDSVGPSGDPGVSGFTPWSSIHPDCTVDPGEGFSISGNIWVDCAELFIKDTLTVTNGSLVLDHDLSITSATGHLIVDNTGAPGFVFMRDGLIRKDGQASLTLLETMVYLSRSSRIQMDGGSGGNLTWIAPDDPDHPFDDLALWSDSTITVEPHFWAGQANLEMEGVFFVPIVTVEYAGQGEQQQTRAQFISDKLHARGQGLLVVAPIVGRAVDFTAVPRTTLIR